MSFLPEEIDLGPTLLAIPTPAVLLHNLPATQRFVGRSLGTLEASFPSIICLTDTPALHNYTNYLVANFLEIIRLLPPS